MKSSSVRYLFVISLAAAGCNRKSPTPADGPLTAATDSTKSGSSLALPVVGEPVRRGDLVLTVNASGEIHTDAQSALKAEAAGRVQEVLIRAGDHVTKGQVLVRLDPKPLDLDLQAATAAYSAAEFSYKSALYADWIAEGAVRPERRNFVRATNNLDGLQVMVDKAKLAREAAVISAPFDGTIESVSVAVGDRIGPGQDIATVVDMTDLRVEARVLEHDLPLLRVGGDAIVTVAAMPDKPVHGVIAAVLPLVDSATRSGRAVIRIRGDGTLRPGMYVDVRLEANRLPNRIIVPARAIIERDNRPLVFVAQDGRAEWVYVNAGRTNGRETEILADSATGQIPLKPGDMVLTEGHLTLTHQAPIRLTPRREGDH